jgi:diguanylate cyclase (GGDEF)-like protein
MRAATAPEVATSRVMASTNGFFYLLGGSALLACLVWGEDPAPASWWLTAGTVSGLAVLTGAALLAWGHRLNRLAFHASVVLGTALICLVVVIAPGGDTATGLAAVFTFVAADTFFFFAWPLACLHLSLALAACSAGLLSQPGVTVGTVVAVDVVIVSIAAVVGALSRRASSAVRDSLTRLPNRRGFDLAMDDALTAIGRSGAPLSVALVDVDHFKAINDTRGHAAGDEVLQFAAARWRQVLPAGAVLARHGGDEFALLLPGMRGPEALTLVERLRTSTDRVSVSCGVAERRAGESASQLLRRADAALYQAKAAGRGRSRLEDAHESLLAARLAAALAAGEVTVAYQPIVDLLSGEVAGVEALARWDDAELGAVPPAEFVRVAESEGLIEVLGREVLRRACGDHAAVCAVLGRDVVLTVNVSGRELVAEGYADRVLEVLHETGMPASRLVLEVTESLLEADAPEALGALARLRDAGMAVAIDDFGTGYSALSRLDTMPADYLKLDSGFVSTITVSPRRAGLVAAMVTLSQALGLRLVAEGVESPAHVRTLTELGCRLGQGFLFGGPAPLPELLTRFAAGRPGSPVLAAHR